MMQSKRVLGLWNFSDNRFHKKVENNEAKKIIRESLNSGIKAFDTAYSYNDSSSLLYSVLKEKNLLYSVEIISKVMPVESLERKAEAELKRLHRDYIDILLLHWPSDDKALYKSLLLLEKLKTEEKAFNIGVSNFPVSLLKKIIPDFNINFHERALSLLWTKDYKEERKLGLKTLSYAPLAFGILTDKNINKELSDLRKNLEVLKNPYFESLKSLLFKFSKESGKTIEEISYSYVLSLNPEYIISGYSNPSSVNKILSFDLPEDWRLELDNINDLITKSTKSENIFSHNYIIA